MCSQEELLNKIIECPGISQHELKKMCSPESKLSHKLGSLRKAKLVTRQPSKKVKMSWDYYPVQKEEIRKR